MTQESSLFYILNSQYMNFVEENKNKDTISRYITEMNFIKKLEEIATKEKLINELEHLKIEKEKVLNFLNKKGVKPKS
ncbi:hypothetical protein IJD15_04630 [bacterium]|nr:hypothetical protein [bacterium]